MVPSSLAILVCLAAALVQPAVGLSYSVCDTILEEYTTSSPRLEGTWPYYSLLYTCVSASPISNTEHGPDLAEALLPNAGALEI